jgi:23S rRNA pseudouridine2605 synthase
MTNAKRPRAESSSVLAGEQRINKLLAAAGLGSRRQVDELITDGRVEIDGKTVTQVGVKVDIDKAKISVDGEPLRRHRPMYFAVNKPSGVLCTNRDPEGRPRVIDLIPGNNRLFPVGRLDASSTGLILLTNDGELAQRLAHPKHSVPKQYFVVVAGQVEPDAMRRLQRGIYLAEGLARVDGAKIRKVRKGCTEIEITLSEGKNREIRRVLARLGHRVVTLRRTAIGPLKLAMLQEGGYRPLSPDEVAALYRSVEEIKRVKKADRKERDQRRATEMEGLGSDTDAELKAAPKKKAAPKTREQLFNDSETEKRAAKPKKTKAVTKSKKWDEEDDGDFDSLPSLAENPYRLPDDDDNVVDPGYEDAILVRDSGPAFTEGTRKGKVLGYSMDDDFGNDNDSEDDDMDSTGMGMMSFDDDDDSDDDEENSMGSFADPFGDDKESDEDFIDGLIESENEGFAPNQGPWSGSRKKGAKSGPNNASEQRDKNSKGAPRNKKSGDGLAPRGRPNSNRTAGKKPEGERSFPPRRGRGRPTTTEREQPAAPMARRSEFGGSDLSDRPIAEQRRSTGGRSYGLPKSSRGSRSGGPAGGRGNAASRQAGPTYSSGSSGSGESTGFGNRTPSGRPASGRPASGRPASGRPASGRPASGRTASGRTAGKPSGPGARAAGPGGKRGGKPSGAPKGKRGGKGRR